jgi:hypothetical protein
METLENRPTRIDPTRARGVTPEVEQTVRDMFEYHAWDDNKIEAGQYVRSKLEAAYLAIVNNVPPCPDRSAALRKLREARMDANSAITHDGKY